MSGLPAASASVGNQSSPEKIPFSTVPSLILPGQRIMHGTRKPPSKLVPLVALNGVIPPSGLQVAQMVLAELPGCITEFLQHAG